MTYKGLDTSLEAGTYSLRANMTMHEIAEALQHGSGNAVTVTIPEGWRAEQVAWVLEQQGLMRSDDFMAEVRSATTTTLARLPAGRDLAGGVPVPGHYEFSKDAKPTDVVGLMLATFDSRVAPQIDGRLGGKTVFDLNLAPTGP